MDSKLKEQQQKKWWGRVPGENKACQWTTCWFNRGKGMFSFKKFAFPNFWWLGTYVIKQRHNWVNRGFQFNQIPRKSQIVSRGRNGRKKAEEARWENIIYFSLNIDELLGNEIFYCNVYYKLALFHTSIFRLCGVPLLTCFCLALCSLQLSLPMPPAPPQFLFLDQH